MKKKKSRKKLLIGAGVLIVVACLFRILVRISPAVVNQAGIITLVVSREQDLTPVHGHVPGVPNNIPGVAAGSRIAILRKRAGFCATGQAAAVQDKRTVVDHSGFAMGNIVDRTSFCFAGIQNS